MTTNSLATSAETVATCISREIHDGDVVGLGLGTFIPAAGAMLAQLTHAPSVDFFLSPAGAYVRELPILTLTLSEWATQDRIIDRPHLSEAFGQEVHPAHVEFFRPAQIDPYGRFNTSFIGSFKSPSLRLPGAAGIPDVTAILKRLYYYLPRHDRRTLVREVDFVTGGPTCIGAVEEGARQAGSRAFRMVTELGVFGFNEEGYVEVLSLHEGITRAEVLEKTGFPLSGSWKERTPPPSKEEITLLRETIDPLGVMALETLPSRERRQRLTEIFSHERRVLEERLR